LAKTLTVALVNIGDEGGITERYPAIGSAYLMGYVEKHLPQVKCYFVREQAFQTIADMEPDLIGISAYTPDFNLSLELSTQLKANWPNIPIVLGGPHVTVMPEVLLNSPFDLGVLGEGEETFKELIQSFLDSSEPQRFRENIKTINGIAYSDEGRLVLTPPRSMIKNLDSIPPPDISRVITPQLEQPNIFITSRGCPYFCAYCAARTMWKRSIRFHSPDYVAEELAWRNRARGEDVFHPKDDMFAIKPSRLTAITEALEKRGLAGKISIETAHTRAHLITDELCRAMVRLGVKSVNCGFESGSPRILKLIKDGPASPEIHQRAIETCNRHGISVVATFMMALPTETEEDIKLTYEFIQRNNISSPHIFLAIPFPGTQLYEMALERGVVGPDFDWGSVGGFYDRIFFKDNLSEEELYAWHEKFVRMIRRKTAGQRWRRKFKYYSDLNKISAKLKRTLRRVPEKS